MNLKNLIKTVKTDMDIVGIPYQDDIPFYINNKSTKTLGACYYRYECGRKVPFKIEISKDLMDTSTEQDVKNTICHELIHSAYPNVGHKGDWKKAAEKMTSAGLGYKISRLSSPERIHKYTDGYVVSCPNCGIEVHYKKKTKTVKIVKGEIPGKLICKCGCKNLVCKDC